MRAAIHDHSLEPLEIASSSLSEASISYVHNDTPRTRTPPPIVYFSQHPNTLAEEGAQDAVVSLTSIHGVKVRDFAYENTLPPVTTVPRFSVQVQPRPRLLQRARDMARTGYDDGEESDEEDPSISRIFYIDSSGTGTSNGSRYRKKGALSRTLTEPVEEEQPLPPQGLNTRAYLLAPQSSLRQSSPSRSHTGDLQFPATPSKTGRRSPQGPSPINTVPQLQPSIPGESQHSEAYVDTPLVTPNGSLQWPVQTAGASLLSDLESVLPQLADSAVTMSQLGFTPERSQPARVSPVSSPLRRQLRKRQLPPPAEFCTRTPTSVAVKTRPKSASPGARVTSSEAACPAPSQSASAPRYYLRQRPQDGKPTTAAPATSPGTVHTLGHAAQHIGKPASKKRRLTPPDSVSKPTRGRRKNGEENR